MPTRENLNLIRCIRKTAVSLILITCITGCGNRPAPKEATTFDPAIALEDYRSYLVKLSKLKEVPTQNLISLMQQWQEMDDDLNTRLYTDTHDESEQYVGYYDSIYVTLRDSIQDQLSTLVESRTRSLEDYLNIVTALNPVETDSTTLELTTAIHKFHESMDSSPIYRANATATIRFYEQILAEAYKNGFHSKQEVFAFLRAEDKAFRSFLSHLTALGDIQLTKVRDNTSKVLNQIVDLANDESKIFDPEEVMILLSHRNNRRLIQNAEQCVADIQAGRITKGEQSSAYLWMLLQPWVSFDAYSFSQLSDSQLKTMHSLAAATPQCIERLGHPEFPVAPEKLPTILIQTFIATL
jgi:hypothetical protein